MCAAITRETSHTHRIQSETLRPAKSWNAGEVGERGLEREAGGMLVPRVLVVSIVLDALHD